MLPSIKYMRRASRGGDVHADIAVNGAGGQGWKAQGLVAEGNEGGRRPRSSEDVRQHAGTADRHHFNVAK